ncbi:MAG: hypothetical protein V3S00_00820, partial [Dehalococcoidia bacterium]
MAGSVERLRKVLALEEGRKFANTAVIGGLDAYLHNFLQEVAFPAGHRFPQILRSLPPGGYRVLHPVQRRRVVEELRIAVEGALPGPPPPPPASPPVAGRSPPPPASPPVAKPVVKTASRPAARRIAKPAARPPEGRSVVDLDSPLTSLNGVSRGYDAKFRRLGVETLRDLLFLFPHRYHDYSQVRPIASLAIGDEQTVLGDVWSAGASMVGRRKATEAIVGDSTGTLRV